MSDEVYNIIDFYNVENQTGYKINLCNDAIKVDMNSNTYNFNMLSHPSGSDPVALEEDVWYCYLVNIDQRQGKIEQFIYKRNVDYEEDAGGLKDTFLRKLYQQKDELVPINFVMEETNPKLLGSDMKVTNLRIFNDIIPVNRHTKLLNQSIIGNDSKNLLLADDANSRLTLPYFPMNE
jgi:hypothetical protein